jgi:hypothetical protein
METNKTDKLYEIRAVYDHDTITVYQAYNEIIVQAALRAGRFVPPFSLNRMTWIKPSFLWMMARSDWGRKPGQERILAIRITRAGWEEALAQAVLTTPNPQVYRDTGEWRKLLDTAPVRVQWDPERALSGNGLALLSQRSIQVGLSRHIIERYVQVWTVEINDTTPLARRIAGLLAQGDTRRARDLLPPERVYPLDAAIARRLGMNV